MAVEVMVKSLIKARVRTMYGLKMMSREASDLELLARSNSAAEASLRYQEDLVSSGFWGTLPKNAFIMDLVLYCEGFTRLQCICNDIRHGPLPPRCSFNVNPATFLASLLPDRYVMRFKLSFNA